MALVSNYKLADASGPVAVDDVSGNTGIVIERLTVASTSANVTDYQGYTTDGTNHYTFGTSALSKWNSGYTVETASNNAPFASLPAGISHLGDGQYYNNFIYVGAENYSSCITNSQQHIVLYNASDLTYSSSTDVSVNGHTVSGLAIDSANNHIYIADYCDSSQVHKYNLTTFAYIEAVAVDVPIAGNANGIYCDGTYLYIASSHASGDEEIYKYTLAGVLVYVYRIYGITEIEGLDFSTTAFRYNSYPQATIKTSSVPTGSYSWGTGNIDLNQKHYIKIPISLATEGTVVLSLKPNTFYNWNSWMDVPNGANIWEGWTDATGTLNFRINSPTAAYLLTGGAAADYKVAVSWEISGANRTVKLYVDDVLRSTQTETYSTPGTRFYIGAGNSGNSASDSTINWFSYFDSVLTLSEITAHDGEGSGGAGIRPFINSMRGGMTSMQGFFSG